MSYILYFLFSTIMVYDMPQCSDRKEHEKSKAVCMIFEEMRSLFWFIEDNLPSEEQERMTLVLFQKLSKFDDITKLAEALLEAKKKIKMSEIIATKAEEDQEKEIWEKKAEYLDGMLEVISESSKSGGGTKSVWSDAMSESFTTM